jgi:DNA replication initiation complex subunit (GINS family)
MKDLIFEWQHHPVRIRMIRECGVLEISEDEKIGPFKEGDDIKLPYWQAKILVNEKYAKFLDLKPIQAGDIYKIFHRELPTSQLTTIDPDFYSKVHEDLVEMTKQFKENQDLRLFQEIEKIKPIYRDLVSRRFYKLLRMAAVGGDNTEALQNCSNEEKELYKRLREIFEEFEAEFLI